MDTTMPRAFFTARWAGALLGLLRIVTALLFLQHATAKLFGFPPGAMPMRPPLVSFFGFLGLFELVTGLAILVGWFTRPVAFLLAGEMAVAYFLGHMTQGFYPIVNKGEPAIMFCFVFLYLSAVGPGAWSVDRG